MSEEMEKKLDKAKDFGYEVAREALAETVADVLEAAYQAKETSHGEAFHNAPRPILFFIFFRFSENS